MKPKYTRKFPIKGVSKSFGLAHTSTPNKISIEAKRFKAGYYIRTTKKANGQHQLWVHEKPPKEIYKKSDFKVTKIQRRVYGSGAGRIFLINVKIKNTKTGQKFEDWVRPEQILTGKDINKLIHWR